MLVERGGMRMSPFFFPMVLPTWPPRTSAASPERGATTPPLSPRAPPPIKPWEKPWKLIRRGDADVMLAGGTEAGISQLGLAGFAVMRALSTRNDAPQQAQ